MFMLTFLSKIHPACHNDADGIKAGSNSNMTDKHAAECSKGPFWGRKLMCVMYTEPKL